MKSIDVISGFRHKVYKKYTLLGYYSTSIGHFLSEFLENLSVPFPRAKDPNTIVFGSLTR